MTDSALERARREVADAMIAVGRDHKMCDLPPRECFPCQRATAAIARLEAAARLAGRIEQLSRDIDLVSRAYPNRVPKQLWDERDRLRAEAGKR